MNEYSKKCSFCNTPWTEREQELRDEIGRLNIENGRLEKELQLKHGRLEKELQLKHPLNICDIQIERALDCIVTYGGIDGDHHKTWVIDQVARWLTGNNYDEFVKAACDGEDGPESYSWDIGTPP